MRCGLLLLAAGFLTANLSAANLDLRLSDAAMRGDQAAVRALLQDHADVNAAQPDGTTALHWAVRQDDLDTVEALLRAGANAKAATRYGVTPLYLAATSGNAAMIEKLLKAGADPNSANPSGETALMTAARTGKVEAVKMLLDHDAQVNPRESVRQQTALMWAVTENHPDVVKLLLAHGADLSAFTRVYVPEGDAPAPRVAGASGAGVARQRAIPTANGAMTPLLFAARDGHREIVDLLLDAGADIKWTSANRTSPLLVAIINGHIDLALHLLERGADPNTADAYGRAPLFGAVEMRDFNHERYPDLEMDGGDPTALIQALLAKGADPNARTNTVPARGFMQQDASWVNFDGETPFLRAALSGDVALMRTLIEKGADPNLPTYLGTTPLMAAAGINYVTAQTFLRSEEEYLDAIKLCLEKGADINATNSEGFTPMHGAANRGWESVIKLLAERGAKLDVKDKEGRTPLTFAGGVFLAVRPPEAKPKAIALLHQLMGDTTTATASGSASAGKP
jgi:ankyrin repeat protein